MISCGGIAEKNPLFMQIYADVIGHPMLIAGSTHTPALGVVDRGRGGGGRRGRRLRRLRDRAGAHDQAVGDAVHAQSAGAAVYDELYGIYRELHDTFGGVPGARADLPTHDEAPARNARTRAR